MRRILEDRLRSASSFVRRADWFTPDRALLYCRVIAASYVPFLIVEYVNALGPKTSPDFSAFWAAGHIAWTDAALSYNTESLKALEWFDNRFQPFVNPPPFLLVVMLFGLLPFAAAFPLWVGICSALYVWAARRFVGIWTAIAYTPTLINQAIGQNGLITGGLFFGATALLEQKPFVAGLLLGSLIIKPHLAIFVPLALLAAGQWRAIMGAATSSIGLLALAYLVFGRSAYDAFFSTLAAHSHQTIGNPEVIAKMQSLYALLWPLVGERIALGVQVAAAAALAVLVWRTWRGGHSNLAKMAMLTSATALASPYLFGYDLAMLLIALAWLGREGSKTGFLPYERLIIGAAFIAPLYSYGIGVYGHINAGVLGSASVFWAVCRRLKTDQAGGRPEVENILPSESVRRRPMPKAQGAEGPALGEPTMLWDASEDPAPSPPRPPPS